jgi:hypothetical protein
MRQRQQSRERRPLGAAGFLVDGVDGRAARIVQQAEEHQIHRRQQRPTARLQQGFRRRRESSSNITPAPCPASAEPVTSTVSISTVGIMISLAGMATM